MNASIKTTDAKINEGLWRAFDNFVEGAGIFLAGLGDERAEPVETGVPFGAADGFDAGDGFAAGDGAGSWDGFEAGAGFGDGDGFAAGEGFWAGRELRYAVSAATYSALVRGAATEMVFSSQTFFKSLSLLAPMLFQSTFADI
jgi:hypothetical protein